MNEEDTLGEASSSNAAPAIVPRAKQACLQVSRPPHVVLVGPHVRLCLQCRKAKRRCFGTPPIPCPYCRKQLRDCTWPTVDERTTRPKRANRASKVNQDVSVYGQPLDQNKFELFPPDPTSKEANIGIAQLPSPIRRGSATLPIPLTDSTWSSWLDWLTTGQPGGGDVLNMPAPGYAYVDPELFIPTDRGSNPDISPKEAQFVEPSPTGQLSGVYDWLQTSSTLSSIPIAPVIRIFEIPWRRPYGKTAITHGRQRYHLKLKAQSKKSGQTPNAFDPSTPNTAEDELFQADGMPNETLMLHLIDTFVDAFGDQFPFLTPKTLTRGLRNRSGSVFLYLAVAAVAARSASMRDNICVLELISNRFSTHPTIALPELRPYQYGQRFSSRARDLLGAMLAFPSRKTVTALTLLAYCAYGDGECKSLRIRLTVQDRLRTYG